MKHSVAFSILAGRNNEEVNSKLCEAIHSAYPEEIISIAAPSSETDKLQMIDGKICRWNSSGMTLSKIRNNEIATAKSKNARYLVMIEDDIEIADPTIFDKYIQLMNKFQIGIIFYPFGGNSNRVFDRPNYNAEIIRKIDSSEIPAICTVSKPTSHLLVLDLERVNIIFDEDLKYFETRDFLLKCRTEGIIPFLGMFFDVPQSWKYVNNLKLPRARVLNMDEVKKEQDRLIKESRWEWKPDNQVTELLKFVASKLDLACRV